MTVWQDIPEPRPPFHPERAGLWERSAAAVPVESRKCGGVTVTTFHLPPPERLPVPGKIVFLSDLHYRDTAAWRPRLASLEAALEQEHPELLLLGGDAVADAVDLPALSKILPRLSRHAAHSFAIPGNWEQCKYWLTREYWREFCRNCGFLWLDNELASCGDCRIAGVEDTRGDPRLPVPPSRQTYNILLSHRPDTAVQLDRQGALERYHLILCGHLHGGQVRLPFFGPLISHSLYGRRFDRGLCQRRNPDGTPGPRMIVTSGLGEMTFPFRFRCPREIVVVKHDRK